MAFLATENLACALPIDESCHYFNGTRLWTMSYDDVSADRGSAVNPQRKDRCARTVPGVSASTVTQSA